MKFFEVADLSTVVVIADDRRRQGGKKTTSRARHPERDIDGLRGRDRGRGYRGGSGAVLLLLLVCSLSTAWERALSMLLYGRLLHTWGLNLRTIVQQSCCSSLSWRWWSFAAPWSWQYAVHDLMMLSSSYSIFLQKFWKSQILRWKNLFRDPGLWRQVWRLQTSVCMDLESFADLVLAFFDNGEFDSTILQSQISTWSWLSPAQNLTSNGQLNIDYACCSSTPRAVPSLLNVQYSA